ncbi:MAG: RND transporter [Gammaproteobacteria bacterium SG8_30]|nr:MAG: RND transporter [Gammaproteobacteria bacterium SG8_30]
MHATEEKRDDGQPTLAERLEPHVFGHRKLILAAFALLTLAFGWIAVEGLRLDTNFTKQLPLKHEYIETYLDHRDAFGGANRLLIAVIAREGDMFTPEFFQALKIATDEVFFIKGVDRSRVQSLWTPNTRYTEVVEGGIQAGDVIPSDFTPDETGLARVRENILKAGIVGRLVANDFSGAMVSAQLLDADPETGEPIDYIEVSRELERNVRQKIQDGKVDILVDVPVSVHMIGFAKVVGDVAEGAMSVVTFAIVTVLLTLLFVWIYIQSFRIALVPVTCSLIAMVWMLGILVLLGYGVDPLGILVPFIIFAIGTSHGVQKISAVSDAAMSGADSNEAARRAFRLLFLPAIVALLSDLVGFVTILLIPVEVIREMAVTASIGIGVIILTDLVLLPVLVSYAPITERYRKRVARRQEQLGKVWERLALITGKGPATVVILIAAIIGVLGFIKGRETPIGDTQAGVPELREDSRYNIDSNLITSKFSIGTDILNVIVETVPNGCIDHRIIDAVDRFAWQMANVEGVRDVLSLAGVSKIVSAGWSEGSLKWRNLPRDERQLVQAQSYIETSSGLLNRDCSVMPVMLFLADHRAETIERVIAAVKGYRDSHQVADVKFRLATGNVGVMAAQNEEVKAKEFVILGWLFGAIIVFCLINFRSVIGTILVIVPLALGSLLVYAVMAMVGIGLKVNTLPMVALGAGIGVDYGIYLFSRMQEFLRRGFDVHDSYLGALRVTGAAIVFTGITLAVGVATWAFSPLKFQADVGLMLTFMFLVNMLGAMLLMPTLGAWLLPLSKRAGRAAS